MPRHCASLLYPWSTSPLSTAHQFGVVVRVDSILNDALCLVTGCLRPTPTDDLPALAGIHFKDPYFHSRGQFRATWNSLPRTSWVRLNRLRTGVGRFHSSMYKWGLASLPNCECGATEQTEDHVISSCLIHHVTRGT